MLIKTLKSSNDKMSTILPVHKAESSEGDSSGKYRRTHKLILVCSNVPKKAITENSKFPCCLST